MAEECSMCGVTEDVKRYWEIGDNVPYCFNCFCEALRVKVAKELQLDGSCPKCKSTNVASLEMNSIADTYIVSNCECNACKARFTETYKLISSDIEDT